MNGIIIQAGSFGSRGRSPRSGHSQKEKGETMLKTRGKHQKKPRRRLHEFDIEHDISYRGPLSYRHLRIMGWLCIAAAQIPVVVSLVGQFDPQVPEQLQTPVQICSFLSNLSLPLLLLANFSIILNTSGGYKMDLLRNGLASLGIIAISFLVYNRYFIGIAVLAYGGRLEAEMNLISIFREQSGSGFMAYNFFIDLFLCTLLMFFLNYNPRRLFTGRRIIIFRLFSVIPIAYELACIVLKILSLNGAAVIPIFLFPFLTVKPPLTFLVFIALAAFIKRREKEFRLTGKSYEEYEEFLNSNRNSWDFAKFTAIALAVVALIDFLQIIIYFIVRMIQLSDFSVEVIEAESDQFISYIMQGAVALGMGDSLMLAAMSPVVLLFSYTRIYRNKLVDIIIPVCGVLLVVFVYIEGIYQIILSLPNYLNSFLLM